MADVKLNSMLPEFEPHSKFEFDRFQFEHFFLQLKFSIGAKDGKQRFAQGSGQIFFVVEMKVHLHLHHGMGTI